MEIIASNPTTISIHMKELNYKIRIPAVG